MTKPSPDQADKKPAPYDREVEVLNPRYKGATPAMVRRALIRNLKPPPPPKEGK